MLSWKGTEEDTRASTKRAPAQPAPRKKGKEPDPQPIHNYLNLYEDIEDADDTSESEVFKDATDNLETSWVLQASTSRAVGSAGHSTASRSKPAVAYEDEIAARLKRLQETRRLVSI